MLSRSSTVGPFWGPARLDRLQEPEMSVSAARLRVCLLPAVLIVGLFGASSVSAAEEATAPSSTVTVAGTGVLAAQGDGHARLAGRYVLTGSLEGGTIEIRGIDRSSTIRVTGWLSRTRLAGGALLYRFGDRPGQFSIAGRSLATNIESDAMRFSATGHGRATLRGEGSYWVNGRGPLPWSDPATEAAF
jgi:hypothetical protein